MPRKITVGLQQKVSRPNYGSIGAICQIEWSIDHDHPTDAQTLKRQISQAFDDCRHHIESQIGKTDAAETDATTTASTSTDAGRMRPASDAQIRALHAIAASRGLRLAEEVNARFGLDSAGQLTLRQASQLIDALKTTAA
ncbi:hypothetical protein [Crateriforma spongiae]|uniref:hypothetical protein n=1 Tax=Crateriforma spongiae TaxID=2724528 RepID=UPI0014476A63|nr:hypothetical protein [Crateriforma spongiae]